MRCRVWRSGLGNHLLGAGCRGESGGQRGVDSGSGGVEPSKTVFGGCLSSKARNNYENTKILLETHPGVCQVWGVERQRSRPPKSRVLSPGDD